MTEYNTRLDVLEAYPAAVKAAVVAAQGDEDLTDLLGVIDANKRIVESHRKSALSEVPDITVGHRYSMRPKPGKYDRTYNFSTLLSKLMDGTGMKLLELMIYLRERDALRFSWQWTNINKVIREFDIDMITSSKPVEDGDTADVGQQWKDGTPGFTRIEED